MILVKIYTATNETKNIEFVADVKESFKKISAIFVIIPSEYYEVVVTTLS